MTEARPVEALEAGTGAIPHLGSRNPAGKKPGSNRI